MTKDDEETPIAYIENLEREVAELKAHINVLREALEYQKTRCEDVIDIRLIDEALASTPAQHNNER